MLAVTLALVSVRAVPAATDSINLPAIAKDVRVKIGDNSLSLDAAMLAAAADKRLITYRQLRAEAGSSPDGQLELARWCSKQKLTEEERLHWRILLMMQPGQSDAMKGLGLRTYDGQMLTKTRSQRRRKKQS
jgi:hypothetical protein